MFRSIRMAALLAIALLAGCTNYTYYSPQPAVLGIRPNPKESSDEARVLVTIAGIRHGSRSNLEMTVRVENLARIPFTFEPQRLALLDAALQPIGGPVGNVAAATVEPDQALLRTFEFPLPSGYSLENDNLAILNVRLTLRAGERDFMPSIAFHRVEYYPAYYYRPYPLYPYGYWW